MELRLKSEKGFTLTETLVALNLGLLVVGFGFLLFLFVTRIAGSWQQKMMVRDAVDGIVNKISTDTERSSILRVSGDTLLVMERGAGRIFYCFESGSVRRNDFLLCSGEKVRIVSQIEELGNDVRIVATGTTGKYEYRRSIVLRANPDSKAIFLRAMEMR